MSPEQPGSLARAIELMEQVLQVEYRFIVHYPYLVAMMPDEESREILRRAGESSFQHATTVIQALRALGVVAPFPSLEALPALPARELFQRQLEYERLALTLCSQAAELVGEEWRDALRRIVEDERWHIQGVARILERLGG